MEAEVTLDYFDGSKSKSRTIRLDGFGLQELAFAMMSGKVCGCTITKIVHIEKAIKKMRENEDG